MTKLLEITPEQELSPDVIHFTDIPVNAYRATPDEERASYSAEDFLDIWRDMCAIREFETILNEIKLKGAYRGVAYDHAGPAHLSIGQEAAAVGMAFSLTPEDHIFGSHRSHGEILAKGFSAIRQLGERAAARDHAVVPRRGRARPGGEGLRGIRARAGAALLHLRRLRRDLRPRDRLQPRAWAARCTPSSRPSASIPTTPSWAVRDRSRPARPSSSGSTAGPGIVVANIGDASFGCGPVWEGITFASMDQYRKLWDPALGGGLPIIFNCMDNFYGMGGQPHGETMGCEFIARIGAGVNPEQMHAERVNGYDPLAVIDAFRRKKEILLQGGGPVLLDTITYRYSGHSPSDASSYRSKEEVEHWQAADSIRAYRERMLKGGLLGGDALDQAEHEAREVVFGMFQLAADLEASPRFSLDSELIGEVMFSNRHVERFDERTPELLQDLSDNSRVTQIRAKIRAGLEDGKPVPKMKVFNIRDAIFEALLHRFAIDPTMVAFGEENRDWGGAFAVYRGLTEALPYHRLFNAPISEAGIVGAAVGYGMEGGRVVAELMYADFMGRAGDELFNQLSKWQAMSAGQLTMPVVVRVSVGSKYGAQHSQDFAALTAHIPGLKVVFPVTPYDAKGMMNAALAGTDPVIFFESQRLYDMGEMFQTAGVPEGYYEIELGLPSVKRSGADLTMVTFGPALYTAVAAADQLAERFDLGGRDHRPALSQSRSTTARSWSRCARRARSCSSPRRWSAAR